MPCPLLVPDFEALNEQRLFDQLPYEVRIIVRDMAARPPLMQSVLNSIEYVGIDRTIEALQQHRDPDD